MCVCVYECVCMCMCMCMSVCVCVYVCVLEYMRSASHVVYRHCSFHCLQALLLSFHRTATQQTVHPGLLSLSTGSAPLRRCAITELTLHPAPSPGYS